MFSRTRPRVQSLLTSGAVDWFLVLPSSHKFVFKASPFQGTLKKGQQESIKLTINIRCTTKLKEKLAVAAKGTGYVELRVPIITMLSTHLDWDEIEMDPDPIGDGAFGTVWRGNWRGTDVAVKRLKLIHFDSFAQDEVGTFSSIVSAGSRAPQPNEAPQYCRVYWGN